MTNNISEKGMVHLVLMIILVIAGVLFYFNYNLNNNQTIAPNVNPTTTPATKIETVSYLEDYLSEPYLRGFKPNDELVTGELYPQELLSLNTQELIPIRCTQIIPCATVGERCQLYNADLQKEVDVEYGYEFASVLEQAKDTIREDYDDTQLAEFTYCESEKGDRLLAYSAGGKGGGIDASDYFATIDSNNNLDLIAKMRHTLEKKRPAYFGCTKPLALTKDNYYYYCHGGDGPAGGAGIFKISFSEKSITELKMCTSVNPEYAEPGISPVECTMK